MNTISKYKQPQNRIHRIYHSLKSLIDINHRCLMCDDSASQRICQTCQAYFLRPQNPCQSCGLPLKHRALRCGACLNNPPAYDEVVSPFLYQAPLDTLINNFKHKGDRCAGKALGEIFAQAVYRHYQRQHLPMPQRLVAVPLHWRRHWRRGFNQAALLCDELSGALNIPIFVHIKRTDSRPAQQHLSRDQRLMNLTDGFKVTRPLKGGSIAIVDDVMTSGATANTLAKLLKTAGADKVSIWALARTPVME